MAYGWRAAARVQLTPRFALFLQVRVQLDSEVYEAAGGVEVTLAGLGGIPALFN